MAKGDVLVRMKADVSNYDANIAKARRTLDGFRQDNLTMGGILKQTSGSLVAAAAKYASFAAVLGTVAEGFSTAVTQGTHMALEMEGVKVAFDRLNQPGLLDNLRDATHNTVNDLELMKQAVKFDNFNLSLDQMGTFLAFAQQQAKDTGQSVDYMVDSIVTGLGRKSLPILDNLGLSANEIREKMKETGDMTTAVAQIIQERMDKAGGYIETAADRAAQSQTRLDNAMIDLGNTMQSLTGTGATLWNDLAVGGINLLNNVLKPIILAMRLLSEYVNGPQSWEDLLTDNPYNIENNTPKQSGYTPSKAQAPAPLQPIKPTKINTKQEPTYAPDSIAAQDALVQKLQKQWKEAGDGVRDTYLRSLIDAEEKLKSMKEEQDLLRENLQGKLLGNTPDGQDLQTSGLGNIMGSATEIGKGLDTLPEHLSPLQQLNAELERLKELLEYAPDTAAYQAGLKAIADKEKEIATFKGLDDANEAAKDSQKEFQAAASAIQQAGSAMQSIEDPSAKVMGIVAQAIGSIALGFAQALAQEGKGGIWYWIAATAAGLATMVSTISAIHSATGYAQGGIVKGNSYSGDNIGGLVDGSQLVGLNAGEIVLNQAGQSNVAHALQDRAFGGMHMTARLDGKDLLLSIDRTGQTLGYGQLVFFH